MNLQLIAPLPTTVDALCLLLNEKKAAAEAAGEDLAKAKSALIDQVQRFGYLPAGAEKSMRLDGNEFVATVTVGSTVEIVDRRVIELQLALSKAKKPRIFPQLFERRVKYSLSKGASELLQSSIAKLSDPVQKRLTQLFSLCFDVNSKSPSLSIESSSMVKAREAKAAKKAAKKGTAR
ncbi:MAG TPA: hypothetical protein VHX37_13380 [Acidobacteriaceae bacterium]|jgi:hypothetical protein|nr:hypothetical protein [Acidobacteriaceae bacterium]